MDWKNRSAYVFIKTSNGKANEVWERFHNWGNIIGTWIVNGEWDVIVWLDVENQDVLHDCVSTIKNWDEVNQTSSHMVYTGWKDNKWWWEKPAGAWVVLRENKLDEAPDKIKNWDWTTSGASIPGNWDYMTWIEGNNWDEVWNHILEMKNEYWDTEAFVPIKSWWNENIKNSWWNENIKEEML